MTRANAFAKDGSYVIVTRTSEKQVGRRASCCKHLHMRNGFVVGDAHAECVLEPRNYDAAALLIVERERGGSGVETFPASTSPTFGPSRR